MNDHVVDFVIRLKNAALARRREVVMPYSKLIESIANVLLSEKYLSDVKRETLEGKHVLRVKLGYTRRTPALTDVLILSKPSVRVYASADEIAQQRGKGIGTVVISTSAGILTGKESQKRKVGGELLFRIW